MATNKSIVLIFSLTLCLGLLSSGASAYGRRTDQERDLRQQYQQCQTRCELQTRGESEQEQCEQRCARQYKQQQEEGQQQDARREYEECQQQCEEHGYRQQPQCQQRCRIQFQERQRQLQECQERCEEHEQGQREQPQCQRRCQQQSREENRREGEQQQEEEEEEGEQQRNNPYYFPNRRSFQTRLREEEGRFKVLQRFAKKSRLLEGIDNYRFALFEANPNTLVLPHHCDTEAIYFVMTGKGTITSVTHENRESYNVECGTVVRVPAGSTVYMVNQDNKEKLTMAVLAMPVNNPGIFEVST